MQCRSARRSLIERELGLLSGESLSALDAHLGGCAACAARERADAALTADLLALRVEAPLPIDVSERVIAELPPAPPTGYEELRAQPFGWAVAGAVASAIALVWGLWELAPAVPAVAQSVGSLLVGAKSLATSAIVPIVTLASASARMLANLLGAATPVFRSLQPIATTAILASFAMMTCTIALVVARDLRKPQPIYEDCR
jgi:hypothetical protein